MTLEQYAQDVYTYLISKIPNIESCIAAEVAEFTTMKTYNYTVDAIAKNNKAWQKEYRRSNDSWEQLLRKATK